MRRRFAASYLLILFIALGMAGLARDPERPRPGRGDDLSHSPQDTAN